MQLTISRNDLARVIGNVARVVEARNTIPILSNLMLTAAGGGLAVMGTDLDIVATAAAEADVATNGSVCVDAKLLSDIAKKAGADTITMTLNDGRLIVKSGRSRFALATLPAEDFPDLGTHDFDAEFDIDLAALFAPVSFAISTEATRYYLNGVFLHNIGGKAVAVATDGHRLARQIGPEVPAFPAVIVPAKLVALMPKGAVRVSISSAKIRIVADDITMTSKLIDGTFPDYERVIPAKNEHKVIVDRDEFLKAADRVVTVSSQKSRAVKLSIADGAVAFSAHSEVGDATDEIAAAYDGEALEVGYNSQYLKDMLGVLPTGEVVLAIADAGSPALVTGGLADWTGVVMPMRV